MTITTDNHFSIITNTTSEALCVFIDSCLNQLTTKMSRRFSSEVNKLMESNAIKMSGPKYYHAMTDLRNLANNDYDKAFLKILWRSRQRIVHLYYTTHF
jgi:hypothetical protein